MADFYLKERIYSDARERPYGLVDNDIFLYWAGGDGSRTYDWWAGVHKGEYGMSPGKDRWTGSEWINDEGRVRHDWDYQGDLGCVDIGQTEPGDSTGSYSNSFSVAASTYGGTAKVGWSHTVGDVSIDNQKYPDDYAQWAINMNSSASKDNWSGFIPGSVIRSCDFDNWEEVLASWAHGWFTDEDWWDDSRELLTDGVFFDY